MIKILVSVLGIALISTAVLGFKLLTIQQQLNALNSDLADISAAYLVCQYDLDKLINDKKIESRVDGFDAESVINELRSNQWLRKAPAD